jgi:putative ABC transport system permease protein
VGIRIMTMAFESIVSPSQLRLASRNIRRHRTRTLISLSAIAFGVVALLLAGGFIEWIYWAIREAAIQTGLGHIQISRPGFRAAGFADPSAYLLPSDAPELETVRSAPGAEVLDQRFVLNGLVSSGEITVVFTGEAVDPEADKLISKVLGVTGDNLSGADASGVLLGTGLANSLGVKRGDRVSFIVSRSGGGINAVEGHVRGTFATGVKAHDDSAVRMPLALGSQLLKLRGAHVWVVGLDATEHTDEAMAYLRARLPSNRFELASWRDLSDFYRKTVVLLSRQIYVVALLIGVIIILGISNTLTMNVLERTGEIGTLMAMGTPRGAILRLFMLEGALLGVIGGVGGLAIGFGLAELVSYVGIPMPPPPGRNTAYSAQILVTVPLALAACGIAIVSTTLAGIYPAWKAASLPIVDALRHNR